MSKKDGLAFAFPNGLLFDKDGIIVGGQRGMTLRAYLASQAISSLINKHREASPEVLAQGACIIADAVLKELEKSGN